MLKYSLTFPKILAPMFNVLFLFVIFRIYKYMAAVNIVNVLTNLLLIEYEIVLMEKCLQNSS